VVLLPGLREVHFGALEGLTWAEAEARHAAVCAEWLSRPHQVVFPGGEGLEAVRRRAGEALAAVRARSAGRTAWVIAHAGVNRALVADALGLRPEEGFGIAQPHGAVNVLDWLGGSPRVRAVAWAPGPR
jgi:broad specificity phosphatase PhoE